MGLEFYSDRQMGLKWDSYGTHMGLNCDFNETVMGLEFDSNGTQF